MSEKVGLEVVATMDVSGVKKGSADARKELALTAAAAAKMDSSLAGSSKGAGQATAALTNLGRVVQDAPFGFIGIANNINPLLESFQRLKLETGSTKQALSALGSSLIGGGGLGLAVSVVTSLLTVFSMQAMHKTGEEADKAGKKVKSYGEILDGIVGSISKEVSDTAGLIGILKNETETRERKLSAIKELQKIQPEVFKNLKLEGGAVAGLDAAYTAYLTNLKSVIAAKLIQAQIEAKVTELLKIQGATNTKSDQEALDNLKKSIAGNQQLSQIKKDLQNTKLGGGFLTDKQEAQNVQRLQDEISGLLEKLSEFSKTIKVEKIKVKPDKVEVEIPKYNLKPFFEKTTPTLNLPSLKIAAGNSQLFFDPKIADNVFNGIARLLKEQAAEKLGAQVSEILNTTLADATAGLGDVLASALSGNGLSDAFDGIKRIIGAGLKQVGSAIIKANSALLVLKKIQFTNPVVGIAVGVAISALGALLQSQIGKVKGFATGVRNFGGGLAMVGERGPELVSLPRGANVHTNAELNASKGDGWNGNVVFEIDGMKLRGILQRTDQYAGRAGFR